MSTKNDLQGDETVILGILGDESDEHAKMFHTGETAIAEYDQPLGSAP